MQTDRTTSRSVSEFFLKQMLYFYSNYQSTNKSPEEFVSFIHSQLLNSPTPLNILTVCTNVKDGVGDYANQLDNNIWLKELFEGYKVILASITFFQQVDKNELAKEVIAEKITPDDLRKNIITIKDTNQLDAIEISNNKIYFIPESVFKDYPFTKIKLNLEKVNFLLNVATSMFRIKEIYNLSKSLPETCLIQSRTEYGVHSPKNFKMMLARTCNEKAMGVASYEAGIKFYPELSKLCKRDEKTSIVDSIENIGFKKILGNLTASEFLASYTLGFAYLQNLDKSREFTLMMAEISKNNPICIVNLDYFKKELLDTSYKEKLISKGYSEIEMIDSAGKSEIVKLTPDVMDNKKFVLLGFKNITQADKAGLISISDAVGGSGNTSFSEMISSGKLPFIQPIIWVKPFYRSFLKLLTEYNIKDIELSKDMIARQFLNIDEPQDEIGLKSNIQKMTENDLLLYKYLALNLGYKTANVVDKKLNIDFKGKTNFDKLIELLSINENKEKILSAWGNYCAYLEKNKNAYDDFLELLVCAIVKNNLNMTDSHRIDELFEYFPRGQIAGITFLHMSLENKLPVDLQIYILNKMLDNNCQLSSTCGQYNELQTPLVLSALYDSSLYTYVLNKADAKKEDTQESVQIAHEIYSKNHPPIKQQISIADSNIFTKPVEITNEQGSLAKLDQFIKMKIQRNDNEVQTKALMCFMEWLHAPEKKGQTFYQADRHAIFALANLLLNRADDEQVRARDINELKLIFKDFSDPKDILSQPTFSKITIEEIQSSQMISILFDSLKAAIKLSEAQYHISPKK